ncbi:MAG TPA: hypothetical protein VFY48_02785 [Solirubrobacterales bacterium]|nr:hypothetical protein [Solirubrobacterales bacterium]
MTPAGELPPFDWAALVPLVVHPVQVAIIESMSWIAHPLSATELCQVFDEPGTYYLSLVSYHLAKLRGLQVIEETGRRPVRGATETFYFFPSPGGEAAG